MPKYIIAGGQFNPFTYDELARPVEQAAQAHLATQDALSQYEAQAGTIGSYIGTGDDNANARALYDNYMQSVQNAANVLYEKGYNRDAAKALADAKARFGTDISRISQAIENREKRAAEYRQMSAKDRLLAEYDPSTKGLDNWLADPQYGNFRHYSGETLINDAAQIGKNLAKEIREDGQWQKILNGQYWESLTRNGASADEINEAYMHVLNGTRSNNPFVNRMADAARSVFQSSGIGEWADEGTVRKAIDYIMEGMTEAIGSQSRKQVANSDYLDAKTRWSMGMQEREFAEKQRQFNVRYGGAGSGSGASSGTSGNPYVTPLINRGMETEGMRSLSRSLNKQFIKPYSNGAITLKNKDGKNVNYDNYADATRDIYSYDLRSEAAQYLGGIDVGRDPMNWLRTDASKLRGMVDGHEVKLFMENGNVVVKVHEDDGKWHKHSTMTERYNRYRQEYLDNLDKWKKNNKGVKLSKYALDPDEEAQFRSNYDIDPTMSTYDLLDYAMTKEFKGDRPAVAVAAPGPNGAGLRTQITSNLIDNVLRTTDSGNGKLGTASGIFKVKHGEPDKNSPVKNLNEFITQKKDGEYDGTSVSSISVDPEAILNGGFYVTTDKGDFFVQANLLGPDYSMFINRMGDYISGQMKKIDNEPSREEKKRMRNDLITDIREEMFYLNQATGRDEMFQRLGATSTKPQYPYGYGIPGYDEDEYEE